VQRIEQVCGRYDVPIRAVALQFALAHPATSAVAGMHSAEEVSENARMVRLPIPEELWVELKAEGLLPAHAPVPSQRGAS
jgi:D-threo-aldose 1-dehydrogenase